jgi:hypothetical protein
LEKPSPPKFSFDLSVKKEVEDHNDLQPKVDGGSI